MQKQSECLAHMALGNYEQQAVSRSEHTRVMSRCCIYMAGAWLGHASRFLPCPFEGLRPRREVAQPARVVGEAEQEIRQQQGILRDDIAHANPFSILGG